MASSTRRFGGVFSDTARPVQLMLMGDSVSAQWLSALVGAAASNPALHALSFARGEAEASRRLMPFNMRLLPHTVQAGLYMLRAIRWPSRSGGSADVAAVQPRRIVLVNPGPHYHIGPLCAFPRFTNNTKICELVKTDRDNGHQTSLREDDPTRCTVGPAVRKHAPPWWGLCNAVRQASGLASVDAFKEDLNAFVRAAAAWQRETPDALVVWLEMAPQHFWPSSGVNGGLGFKGNAGKVAGCKDDCCSATPLQYLPPLDAWHSDIRARCAMVHSLDDVATAPPACREAFRGLGQLAERACAAGAQEPRCANRAHHGGPAEPRRPASSYRLHALLRAVGGDTPCRKGHPLDDCSGYSRSRAAPRARGHEG